MFNAFIVNLKLLYREPLSTVWTAFLPAILFFAYRYHGIPPDADFAASLSQAVPYLDYICFSSSFVGITSSVRLLMDSGIIDHFSLRRQAKLRLLSGLFLTRLGLTFLTVAVMIGVLAILRDGIPPISTSLLVLRAMLAAALIGVISMPIVFIFKSHSNLQFTLQAISILILIFAISQVYPNVPLETLSLNAVMNPISWCDEILSFQLKPVTSATIIVISIPVFFSLASAVYFLKRFLDSSDRFRP